MYKYTCIYKLILKVHYWGCSLAVNEFKTTKIKVLAQSLFGFLAQSTVWGSLQMHPYTLFFHRMSASFCTQNCQFSPVNSYFMGFFFLFVPHITSCLFTNSNSIHRHSFPQNGHAIAPECFTCTNKLIFTIHCKWKDSALTHIRD